MTITAETLDRSRGMVAPALRLAVERLDPFTRLVVSYHLGWSDEYGTPTVANPGKTLRPALALLAAEAVTGRPEPGLPGAVAVELVHNFSLLHDDLMDRDTERRHRRTVWAVWGDATAVLAGDALLSLAHEVLTEGDSPDGQAAGRALAIATRELIRGQVLDLAFEQRNDVTLDECLDMAAGKTGALLGVSAAIGAILVGAPQVVVRRVVQVRCRARDGVPARRRPARDLGIAGGHGQAGVLRSDRAQEDLAGHLVARSRWRRRAGAGRLAVSRRQSDGGRAPVRRPVDRAGRWPGLGRPGSAGPHRSGRAGSRRHSSSTTSPAIGSVSSPAS